MRECWLRRHASRRPCSQSGWAAGGGHRRGTKGPGLGLRVSKPNTKQGLGWGQNLKILADPGLRGSMFMRRSSRKATFSPYSLEPLLLVGACSVTVLLLEDSSRGLRLNGSSNRSNGRRAEGVRDRKTRNRESWCTAIHAWRCTMATAWTRRERRR